MQYCTTVVPTITNWMLERLHTKSKSKVSRVVQYVSLYSALTGTAVFRAAAVLLGSIVKIQVKVLKS